MRRGTKTAVATAMATLWAGVVARPVRGGQRGKLAAVPAGLVRLKVPAKKQ